MEEERKSDEMTREDEQPETHTFYEKSEFGLFEGTVTVAEKEEKYE